MEKVAFIIGGSCIYWSSIVQALAVAAGACAFVSQYVKRSKNHLAAAFYVPLALLLSALLGRMIHWYSRTDSYAGFSAAMTDYSWGSYALIGVFVGCLLAALLIRLLWLCSNVPLLLDCAAIGVGTGIAVGRLSFFFNASDRGLIVPASWGIPLAFPVTNPVSGLVENRLATFLLQSIVTACIVIGLSWYSSVMRKCKRRPKHGDICALFMGYYCASQVFFDSTRYDSLFLRSNGFVSIVQILSAVMLVLVMLRFTIPLLKGGKKTAFAVLWVLFLVFVGGAGFMEYYVQRHGDAAGFAYSVMISCLCVIAVLMTVARHLCLGTTPKTAKEPKAESTPQRTGRFSKS